jgi:hypothetical protein
MLCGSVTGKGISASPEQLADVSPNLKERGY